MDYTENWDWDWTPTTPFYELKPTSTQSKLKPTYMTYMFKKISATTNYEQGTTNVEME